MKDFLKNKIKVILIIAVCIASVAAVYAANNVFGNPVSRANAEKNIKAYIVDTYETTDFVVTELIFDSAFKEYVTTVTFENSDDIVFDVSYSVNENRINDNYADTVGSGFNTLIRLSSDYGSIVSDALAEKYGSEVFVGYGELGKNQTLEQISSRLYPDMEFDMYNLPLEATVSVFLTREDTSSLQFAKDLTELQLLMYSKDIAVDYYDIMYNNSILLEDFPSITVVENLENTEQLAQCIDDFMK